MSSSYTDRPEQEPRPPQADAYTDRPALPRVAQEEPPLTPPKLGSLAQKARGGQLNQARGILLAIGILTILVNGFMMLMIRDEVRKEIDKELMKAGLTRATVDPVKVKEVEGRAVMIGMLVGGVAVLLGVLFVIFGLIVKKYPVGVTITSLVLYVGATLVFGVLDPATLAAGAIVKILIVIGLAKAIQSALAYERAAREEADLGPGY